MKTNLQLKSTQGKKNKTSVSETGHAKNVANFETEIAFCIGYGADYNPVNPILTISNLQVKWDNAKLRLKAVKDTKEPFDSVTGSRQILFKPVRPLTTRVINALIASNAPATVVKDARTIIRKINGKRASQIKEDIADTKMISVSQQSYDRLVDNLEELIVLVQTETLYNPNESELKTTALQIVLNELTAANTSVRNAFVPYSNAMIARDVELYALETGLVDLAFEVKSYVKSLFGSNSPQYRQISGLIFKRPAE